eukprot:3927669-Ditylum_brightwellii.AAC.1
MNGPDADGFKDAMDAELGTLTDMKSWVIVTKTKGMYVLGSTWAFKMKRFPNGTIHKLKARLLGWASAQIDYTAAFVNAAVEEEIFVEMPQGYKKEGH